MRVEPALFQVSSRDPLVLTSAAALVLLVTAADALLPSLRATRVDPMSALRAD
jgi:ABC-type lipoprotein release transport system permease subunit